MTLDEFVQQAPATLARFEKATRILAVDDPSMNPNEDRSEWWWWRDVGAFLQYTTGEALGLGVVIPDTDREGSDGPPAPAPKYRDS